ncbi:unnamed protein product [Amoebophrya sp. A25]|nr:unnamed protein product [Amoebophrya sp. A25]|eukprot:GSA25T00001013001.1
MCLVIYFCQEPKKETISFLLNNQTSTFSGIRKKDEKISRAMVSRGGRNEMLKNCSTSNSNSNWKPAMSIMFLGVFSILIPFSVGERVTFSVTILLSLVLFLVILSEYLPRSESRTMLTNQLHTLMIVSSVLYVMAIIILLTAAQQAEMTERLLQKLPQGSLLRRVCSFLAAPGYPVRVRLSSHVGRLLQRSSSMTGEYFWSPSPKAAKPSPYSAAGVRLKREQSGVMPRAGKSSLLTMNTDKKVQVKDASEQSERNDLAKVLATGTDEVEEQQAQSKGSAVALEAQRKSP